MFNELAGLSEGLLSPPALFVGLLTGSEGDSSSGTGGTGLLEDLRATSSWASCFASDRVFRSSGGDFSFGAAGVSSSGTVGAGFFALEVSVGVASTASRASSIPCSSVFLGVSPFSFCSALWDSSSGTVGAGFLSSEFSVAVAFSSVSRSAFSLARGVISSA